MGQPLAKPAVTAGGLSTIQSLVAATYFFENVDEGEWAFDIDRTEDSEDDSDALWGRCGQGVLAGISQDHAPCQLF
jgi:hypothetical protein